MKFNNERDIEIPAIIDFIKSHPLLTLLDVGAHWSHAFYASQVRMLVDNYDAIDILPDPQTKAMVDKYIQGNVLDYNGGKYDLVTCISTIEHAGITTYKIDNYEDEQLRIFKKILDLSKKYILITFPFGQKALHEGQFANITKENLAKFLEGVNGLIKKKFYFSEFAPEGEPWIEVNEELASKVEYISEKGTRCICILTIEL